MHCLEIHLKYGKQNNLERDFKKNPKKPKVYHPVVKVDCEGPCLRES